MSKWIIGDLHGCAATFGQLRAAIEFDETRDRLILVGDLINRGPASLQTLRWIVDHQNSLRTVLGNHDLHLLWCALGCGMPKHKDTLDDILQSPDREELIHWLRAQPLALEEDDALIVHAGIHPDWTVDYAQTMSERASQCLRADDAGNFLNRWRAGYPNDDSEREIFRAMDILTRMRTLRRDTLALDLAYSGALADTPASNIAWFKADTAHARPAQVFFGHWAALGFHSHQRYQCLDSGAAWGRAMTAWRLEDGRFVTRPTVEPRRSPSKD